MPVAGFLALFRRTRGSLRARRAGWDVLNGRGIATATVHVATSYTSVCIFFGMRTVGLPELTVVVVIAVLYAFPLWRIARKMGYPGPLGLLACLPGINMVIAYFLAFSEWPVLREVALLRDRHR
jgi:hypothetical protein